MSAARVDIAFPYGLDGRGRTAESPSYEAHVREMVEQLLFTDPGERVNRPDLGCGLMQLTFGPLGDELLASTRLLLQSNLQRWLGEVIAVEGLEVSARDSTLAVTVRYVVLASGQRRQERFER